MICSVITKSFYAHVFFGFVALWTAPAVQASERVTNLNTVESATAPPIIGAIRWDGWYGTGGVVRAVEQTLGQPKYHNRLPWFAKLLGDDKVGINGDSPAIMELEISYAARAGLNYWAFLNYWQDSPSLGIGLKRYLDAKDKKGVRYCLIEEGGRLDKIGTQAWSSLVEHFSSPDYQKVLGGRPLLFVYMKPSLLVRAPRRSFRRR